MTTKVPSLSFSVVPWFPLCVIQSAVENPSKAYIDRAMAQDCVSCFDFNLHRVPIFGGPNDAWSSHYAESQLPPLGWITRIQYDGGFMLWGEGVQIVTGGVGLIDQLVSTGFVGRSVRMCRMGDDGKWCLMHLVLLGTETEGQYQNGLLPFLGAGVGVKMLNQNAETQGIDFAFGQRMEAFDMASPTAPTTPPPVVTPAAVAPPAVAAGGLTIEQVTASLVNPTGPFMLALAGMVNTGVAAGTRSILQQSVETRIDSLVQSTQVPPAERDAEVSILMSMVEDDRAKRLAVLSARPKHPIASGRRTAPQAAQQTTTVAVATGVGLEVALPLDMSRVNGDALTAFQVGAAAVGLTFAEMTSVQGGKATPETVAKLRAVLFQDHTLDINQ